MILNRLTFFTSADCPSWDVAFVRSIMDFAAVLDAFSGRFEQTRAHILSTMSPGEKGLRAEQEDLYDRYGRKIQLVKSWFEHRVKYGSHSSWDWEQEKEKLRYSFEEKRKESAGAVNAAPDGVGSAEPEIQLDPSLFDGLNDDSFWFDLAGDWGNGMELSNNNFVTS